MPRKLIRRLLPDHDSVRAYKFVQWFGPLLHHPNLWHLNRRSVAGGVAIGMFCGLIPGPFQMLGAAVLAIPLRVNLPVAITTTLYTNPLTIVPLYIIAFALGRLVTGSTERMVAPPDFAWTHIIDSTLALGRWMLDLGRPLAIGLFTLALLLAVCGYLVVQIGWRAHVVLAWRRRRRARARSLSSRAS